jgi:cell division GTPase FtsZ
MNETKRIAIIGCGNCGSQVALMAERKYPDIFDCIYINTSESDLAMVNTDSELKFKIGKKEEVEGSGKNRTKMKEYLMEDINNILTNKNLQDTIYTKKYCFVIASAAGGTGSGAAPVLMEIMRQMFPDTNFILVGVLPQISASLMEQGNALEFLNELYDVLGDSTTYMIYDNENTADLPPTKALEVINENIVEDLKVLSGVDNYPTPYESIDEADMESIITTPGRLLVVRLTKKLTEKNMEDSNLDDMIIKAIKQSAHAETDRNKKVVRLGIITYFTDAVNRLYSANLYNLTDFIGTPIERFNHNAINKNNESLNFFYLIASGMSPINDRVVKITERIAELKNALASDESSRYILSGDGASYDVMETRRKADKRANTPEEINPADIFKKFMK